MDDAPLDDVTVLGAFREILTFPTTAGDRYDAAAFAGLGVALRRHFPRLFSTCERVDLGTDALLLRWPGRDAEADPLVLMAHQDVVPIEPNDVWRHPPFEAVLEDGVLWGRGTLDCKGSLVAICVAVERLMTRGAVPERDVWLSFGADEEVSGDDARRAVDVLQARGVHPWLVLDEGGAVADDAFAGLSAPLAVIGVAEKGTVELQLTAQGDGGHASTPRRGGATVQLARAIIALDRHPSPARLDDASVTMLEGMAEVASGPMAAVLRRARTSRRALAPLLARLGPETAAMVRTTTAVTKLSGSPAINVVATTARAYLNMRVAVGETLDEAVARVRRTVGDGIEVTVLSGSGPSPVAPSDGAAFALLRSVTADAVSDAHVVPYVMNQATDARHFHAVWPDVYRFTPFRMSRPHRESLHNVDEHIDVSSWLEGITWYQTLVERC